MTGFGATPTTTGQGTLAANQMPISSVAVPGHSNGDLTALEGGPESTDSNSNKTAPASVYIKDGNDVTMGTQADAAWGGSGAATQIAILKKLVAQLNAAISVTGTVTANVEQVDLTTTGTISAAQPVIGTPVSNATVSLALAQGQSTFKAQLINGGGGFTSGTTLVVDKSLDGGTTWLVSSFKVGGSLTNTTVQSIVGPGPLELTGNASGITHVRIRCSVLNSTETIAVTLRGGAGIGDVGLISSIPSGLNTIGTLTPFVDTTATGSVTTDLDTVAITLSGGQATALVQITTSNLNGTLLFEASPDAGTTYYAVQGVQVGLNTIATSVAGTGGNQAAGVWRFNVAGFTNFHVKLHPVTGGTATIKIILTQGVQDVAIRNAVALGQNTKANSTSVTIASDQSSVASPLTTNQQTEAACEAAQAFIATTGTKTATVAANQALSVFNPAASGKTLRIKRILGVYGVTANGHPDFQLTYQTTDPAFSTTITSQNMSLGGAASVASVTQTAVGTGASIAGTMLMEQDTSSDNAAELLTQGFFYKVPPGTGVTLYFNAANTSTYAMNMQWIEY